MRAHLLCCINLLLIQPTANHSPNNTICGCICNVNRVKASINLPASDVPLSWHIVIHKVIIRYPVRLGDKTFHYHRQIRDYPRVSSHQQREIMKGLSTDCHLCKLTTSRTPVLEITYTCTRQPPSSGPFSGGTSVQQTEVSSDRWAVYLREPSTRCLRLQPQHTWHLFMQLMYNQELHLCINNSISMCNISVYCVWINLLPIPKVW